MSKEHGSYRHPIDGVPPGSPLDYALRYADLGWYVFPVHSAHDGQCSCGDTHCKNVGKHPIWKLTPQGFKDATLDRTQIRAWWRESPWANVAIRTGKVSGFFAIDVDIKPEEGKFGNESLDELTNEHGELPDTIEAITGSLGRHILFKYPGWISRIPCGTNVLGKSIDVRADDGYIVAEPSMHKSGQAYIWEGSSDPLEGMQLADAPQGIIDRVIKKDLPVIDELDKAQSVGFLSPGNILELRSAMSYLDVDDRDWWLQVGMALHATGAGQQAYGLWTEWSQQSEKFNSKDQRRVWNSFKDKGNGINKEAIFAWAQSAGWVNPASTEASEFQESIAKANLRQKITVVEEEKKHNLTPIPVGILSQACQWIDEQFPITHAAATQHAVLSLACTIASRRYESEFGDPAHNYLGIVAPSVGDIRYLRTALHKILSESGLRRIIRGTRFTSPQTIYSTLLRSPACIYVTDEYGQMIQFARRQPSGLLEQAMNVMAEAHASKALYLDNATDAGIKHGAGDDQPVIRHPGLNILALLADDQLAGLMKKSEIGRGALEQVLLTIIPEEGLQKRSPVESDVPTWLQDHIRKVRKLPAGDAELDLVSIFQGNAELIPTITPVPFKSNPRHYEQGIIEVAGNDRHLLPLAMGACQSFRRLSVALSAWQNPDSPLADHRLVEWAAQYVISKFSESIERYHVVGSDEGKLDIYQKVFDVLISAGRHGLTGRELIHKCWAYRNLSKKKRNELIDALLDDKAIYETETANRQGVKFIAAQFVKENKK